MKTKLRYFSLTICLFIFLSIIGAFTLNKLNAFAYAGMATLSEEELYNATNTYNVMSTCFNEDGTFIVETETSRSNPNQYYLNYDLTEKNSNAGNIMNTTQITVLTHGLGSEPSAWSNNFSENKNKDISFVYDEASLIGQIKKTVVDANIYWAVMTGYTTFELYDITTQLGTYTKNSTNKVEQIVDISKHIIIVFDALNPNESNANLYYQFNYMLSRIIYDVKILNEGKLPKINLVGHSRGGLTNLQYALDHPDLVSTMVSLGTPYFGSTNIVAVFHLFSSFISSKSSKSI